MNNFQKIICDLINEKNPNKKRCDSCKNFIDVDKGVYFTVKVDDGNVRKTISSGFPTGVTVREIRKMYHYNDLFYCTDCYEKRLKEEKKEKILKRIGWCIITIVPAVLGILFFIDGDSSLETAFFISLFPLICVCMTKLKS